MLSFYDFSCSSKINVGPKVCVLVLPKGLIFLFIIFKGSDVPRSRLSPTKNSLTKSILSLKLLASDFLNGAAHTLGQQDIKNVQTRRRNCLHTF